MLGGCCGTTPEHIGAVDKVTLTLTLTLTRGHCSQEATRGQDNPNPSPSPSPSPNPTQMLRDAAAAGTPFKPREPAPDFCAARMF